MLYRENGQFKVSYAADQQIFPILQDRIVIGLLLSIQSYCLYSAVALIPVALALLAFQTFPMVLALLSWISGGDSPSRRVRIAMPIALIGLALALDVAGRSGDFSGRWSEIGTGVLWAIGIER